MIVARAQLLGRAAREGRERGSSVKAPAAGELEAIVAGRLGPGYRATVPLLRLEGLDVAAGGKA